MADDKEITALIKRAMPVLTRIAMRWTDDHEADSADLAQQAISEAWADSPDERDLKLFVKRAAMRMKGHLANRRRLDKRREDPKWTAAAAERLRGRRRTPEDIASTHELKERWVGRLTEDVKDNRLERAVVEQILSGNDTPEEQAEVIVESVGEINKARKRVSRRVDAIRAEEGDFEVPRGWDVEETMRDEEEEEREA